MIAFRALTENPTEQPLLRNFLRPLQHEEPTLVTWPGMNGTKLAGQSGMRRSSGCHQTGLVMDNDWTRVLGLTGLK